MIDILALNKIYTNFRQHGYENKRLSYDQFISYLSSTQGKKEEIGKSFLNQTIYKLSIGKGDHRILIWSQMHGNESTGTRAMMDVWNFLNQDSYDAELIKNNLKIDYIPMLNPDGSNLHTRRNAIGIDINRDFISRQSVEIRLLIDQVEKGQYHTLFNLHDQRTIFSVGITREPATLSFLAPAYNVAEDVNEVRQRTMGIIQAINNSLQQVIKGKVGRYSSEYYPCSTGDNFTKMGYPTVLFEAGYYPNDEQRNETRKFNAFGIISGLYAIASKKYLPFDQYEKIPQNAQRFFDILIKNVSVNYKDKKSKIDLGIYFDEILNGETDQLTRIAKIKDVGDLSYFYGHQEYDMKGATYKGDLCPFPKLDEIANFSVENLKFSKGKLKLTY